MHVCAKDYKKDIVGQDIRDAQRKQPFYRLKSVVLNGLSTEKLVR